MYIGNINGLINEISLNDLHLLEDNQFSFIDKSFVAEGEMLAFIWIDGLDSSCH